MNRLLLAYCALAAVGAWICTTTDEQRPRIPVVVAGVRG